MGQNSNPAGSEGMKSTLIVVAVLTMIGCSVSKEPPSPIVQKAEACGAGPLARHVRCGCSGLVWKTSRLRGGGGRDVQASSREGDGTVDRFHGRPRLRGSSEHCAMGAQAVRRSREVPVRLEVA